MLWTRSLKHSIGGETPPESESGLQQLRHITSGVAQDFVFTCMYTSSPPFCFQLLFTKIGILAIWGLISISHYPVKSQLMSFAQTLISSMPFAHSPSFKPLTHTLPPHQTGSVVQCRQIGIKDCVEKNLFTPVRIALSSAHVSSIETVIHRLSIASSSHLILSELGWCFLPLHTGE